MKGITLHHLLIKVVCNGAIQLSEEIVSKALTLLLETRSLSELDIMVSKLLSSRSRTPNEWDILMEPLLEKAITTHTLPMFRSLLRFGKISITVRGKLLDQLQQSNDYSKNNYIQLLPQPPPERAPADQNSLQRVYDLLATCCGKVIKVIGNILRSIQKVAGRAKRLFQWLFNRSGAAALPAEIGKQE
jgi:hypothetical protein